MFINFINTDGILRSVTPAVEFVDEVAGIYFRSTLLSKGDIITQHTHDYDHATYVGSGAARLFINDIKSGDIQAGHAVKIAANTRHHFEALEPNTRLVCVHDVASAESIKRKGL